MERIIIDQRVERCREQLQEMRLEVEKARQIMGDTVLADPFATEIQEILHIALAYQPTQSPAAAVYALAQVTDRLRRLLDPWRIMTRYEDVQETLRHLEVVHG